MKHKHKHKPDTTQIIIWENDMIQRNHKCQHSTQTNLSNIDTPLHSIKSVGATEVIIIMIKYK